MRLTTRGYDVLGAVSIIVLCTFAFWAGGAL